MFLRHDSSEIYAQDTDSDLLITVHSGTVHSATDAERVFHAPFVEEVDGIQIVTKQTSGASGNYHPISLSRLSSRSPHQKKMQYLSFPLLQVNGICGLTEHEREIDPFEYPLDGLILYYLTVINGDIMIHASGVNNQGQGYLFSGVSGKGKSTMAKLWNNTGAKVIHDDRLIYQKYRYMVT